MIANVVSQTLKHVWTALEPLNLPMAVMGGLALARWQHVRATRDVDLLLALGSLDLDKVLATLQARDVHARRSPPKVSLGSLSIVQLNYEVPETFIPVQIDLLLAESEYHRTALARSVSTRLPDMDLEVSVLTCEDLVLHKLLAGRIIDRADSAALLRANRDILEVTYLQEWVAKLELKAGFKEVWLEAFPGASLPE